MKHEEELSVIQRILYSIMELIIFCTIWIFVGPYVININTHSSLEVFDCNSPYLSFLLYGVAVYIGGKIIYYSVSRIVHRIKSKHN